MKCPYCAEEIKDEALVCRFCQRDLIFFKPISERLAKIEDSILDLRASIGDLRVHSPEEPVLMSTTIVESPKSLIAVVFSILLAFLFYWMGWHFPTTFDTQRALNVLSVIAPLFAAFGLRVFLPRLRLSSYALLGSIAGLGGFAQVVFVYHFYVGKVNANWITLLLAYIPVGIFSFLLAGPFRQRSRIMNGSPESASPNSHPWLRTIGNLIGNSEWLTQVATIMKALATIVSLILSYIGAKNLFHT